MLDGDILIVACTFLLCIRMATTRLRKTLHYPADESDEDDTLADLDEEGSWQFSSLYVIEGMLIIVPRAREAHPKAKTGG